MLSKTSLLTIKALLQLSDLPAKGVLGAQCISQKIRAPQNYLGKVLQRLAKEGIVISKKGLNGGFRLSKPPEEINLYDIVTALEGVQQWEGCFMGQRTCSASSPCCAHERWALVRGTYGDFLKHTTIADLKKGEKHE